MTRIAMIFTTLATTTILGACGGDEGDEMAEETPPAAVEAPAAPTNASPMAPPGAAVEILSPSDGETVEAGGTVVVRLQANNVPIVPATDTTSGTGHHHLFVNADVSPEGEVIPTITNEVVHMGTGVSEYTFEGLPSGEHRLIAVVADYRHIPLMPWVVDTVRFVIP